MHGLTDHELALAAHGGEQARLITATIGISNYVMTNPGMPSTGRPNMTLSFTMPGGEDNARVDRLAEIAAWLRIEPINRGGSLEAYKDFDGIRFGAHFTPQFEKERRAQQLMASLRSAA